MPFLKPFLLASVIFLAAYAGHCQPPSWNPLRYGKLTLKYPDTWVVKRETMGNLTRVTLTPDSMKTLSMRLIEILRLPYTGGRTFADFKEAFTVMLKGYAKSTNKVPVAKLTTLKGHRCLYAEGVTNSLPLKLYGVDAGSEGYIFAVLPRRYISIPDPKMERDEAAIFDAIVIGQ